MRRSAAAMGSISMWCSVGCSSAPSWRRLAVAAMLAAAVAAEPRSATPKFFPDDPLWTDDDRSLDASQVGTIEDTNGYDFVINTFASMGERRDVRALNVNTVDEVPDSSWFTNRIGRRTMTVEEIVRGPDARQTFSLDGFIVSGDKGSGVQAGFRMIDPSDGNQMYQIELDPPSNPEMATGAEMIGTAFYSAFGYTTVEVYLAEFDPATVVIAPNARMFDPLIGEKRPLTRLDLDRVLRRGARLPNGRYRVLASKFAPGRPVGNFRYYRTRPDDPNDIIPHEHRRELRGARVFGAWLNHDDSRGVNSLDMLVTEGSQRYIKHYMFDFGSILGSGTVFAQRHRAGNEYIVEWRPGWLTLATLGLWTRPWMHYDYPDVPASVGRFEAEAFDPLAWRPEYPNPAFENMRPDDAFWAAHIVSKFSDEAIRAVVAKARYSDPRASEYVASTLITRRDKVLRVWLTGVNPVVDVTLSAGGQLTFKNAAVDAGLAKAPAGYRVSWAAFDNTTRGAQPISDGASATTSINAPAALPSTVGTHVRVAIAASAGAPESWTRPVHAYFRKVETGWTLVGFERIPDAPSR
jgi:hypothetical protein